MWFMVDSPWPSFGNENIKLSNFLFISKKPVRKEVTLGRFRHPTGSNGKNGHPLKK